MPYQSHKISPSSLSVSKVVFYFSKPSLTSATLEQNRVVCMACSLNFLSDLSALDLRGYLFEARIQTHEFHYGLTVTQDIAYDYLELPVLFKFKTMKGFFSKPIPGFCSYNSRC